MCVSPDGTFQEARAGNDNNNDTENEVDRGNTPGSGTCVLRFQTILRYEWGSIVCFVLLT